MDPIVERSTDHGRTWEHLALGASAHLWPLLLAVVGATWWFRWWRDRPRRPVDPPRVHHRLGPPGPAPKTEADR